MDGWTFPFVSFIIISRMLKNRGKEYKTILRYVRDVYINFLAVIVYYEDEKNCNFYQPWKRTK